MAGVIVISPDELEQLLERVVEKVLARGSQKEVLSVSEAAAYAKRQPDTVRGWIDAGLPAKKRGRVWVIRREDLDRYLAGERAQTGPSAKEVVDSLRSRPPGRG